MLYLREESHVIILHDFAIVTSNNNYHAIISIEDAELISLVLWNCRWFLDDTKQKPIFSDSHNNTMHRVIMGVTNNHDVVVDHVNGDTLDNRRENLRTCTQQQNTWNNMGRNNPLGYKGIVQDGEKYVVRIMKDGKQYYGGRHDSAELAALQYDVLARKLYGKYANTNF